MFSKPSPLLRSRTENIRNILIRPVINRGDSLLSNTIGTCVFLIFRSIIKVPSDDCIDKSSRRKFGRRSAIRLVAGNPFTAACAPFNFYRETNSFVYKYVRFGSSRLRSVCAFVGGNKASGVVGRSKKKIYVTRLLFGLF